MRQKENKIFPNFWTSEGGQPPSFGEHFLGSEIKIKKLHRSTGLRARMIPHMTKSIHCFGFKLWCYRFESLRIIYFRLFCNSDYT